MRNLRRTVLIVIVALIAIGCAAIIGINLYVQSPGMQSRIQQQLSQALGMPLKMTGSSFNPGSGVQINGVTVPHTDPADAGEFLSAPKIVAHLRLMPLFRGRLVIDEIVVDEPKLVWVQNKAGKWVLPRFETPEPPVAAEFPPPIPPAPPGELPAAPVEREPRLEVRVSEFRLHDGSLAFYDSNREQVASLANVRIRIPSISASELSGEMYSRRAAIAEKVNFENARTPFFYRKGELSLPEITADVAEGKLNGSFQIHTGEEDSPYTVGAEFRDVNLDELIVQTGGEPGQFRGTLQGSLTLYGNMRDTRSAAGKGQVTLLNGQVKQYELFQVLGYYLQIEELAQLELQEAHANFHVSDGKVHLEKLFLQSPNVQLVASGDVALDGKLDLAARLTVNQKISRQLPGFIEANFTPVDDTDLRYINFNIGGTLSRPTTNLAERMVGRKIEREVTTFLRKILRTKKKKDENTQQ